MSVNGRFADHFSARAAGYAQFRPGYPAELFAYLAAASPARDTMWDCASGSGQAARQFSDHFAAVIASDASHAQISKAGKSPRLYYLSCLAEQTPFRDQCFDLISVAQALHWFDLERFYAEVRRLLKPGGVFAAWSYGLMRISPAIDEIVNHLYTDIVGSYWPFERRLVENGYRDLAFPFHELEPPPFAMQADWTLEHLLGYLSTWSAVKRYMEAHDRNPLQQIHQALISAWGDQPEYNVNWPLSLRAGTL